MKTKINYLILSIGLMFAPSSFGQLQTGSIAPNFTLTDINGSTHTLYDYLDAGKTVYLDFFACHCPYCWNYHNSHALSNLYDQYGPNTASNDVFVFAIEFDPNNGNNEFYGISGNTQGNWVAGTNYPQINPEGGERDAIISDYEVNLYPLIYAICPDRTITVIGTKNTSQLYAHAATCAPLGLQNLEETFSVSQHEATITIQSSMNFDANQTTIILTDIQGKQLLRKSFSGNIETLDLKDINHGIYFIQIVGERQIVFSKKIQF
ncbi:redoxin family protein [Fluviicola taffensis]|uniref:Alkyl hydroperoxide reductase/ Thiol specific antioxidant/ Mal allergen n=1 Tax=Fluviicola taffensis (strain DSM 16823 / NCIMB 13979 / RW262) TaxID=755732 RepID=F2IAU7_FLUTR|nr:T9SS type A sorting domain-containing protein [Fluviicola taffensis]AEA45271.1 alkyl hydroperoxide reductase/ Thiol specific antioxidant/ Mal allergen [Fluviicola taffensis DSM 16823]